MEETNNHEGGKLLLNPPSNSPLDYKRGEKDIILFPPPMDIGGG